MFISGLSIEKQKAFLNLAYTMILADGRIDDYEQKMFDSYALEVNVDLKEAHKVDFEKELFIFDDSSTSEKKKVFFELYAIALVDKEYPVEESKLVDIMKARFNISDNLMKEMKDGLYAMSSAYEHLQKILSDD